MLAKWGGTAHYFLVMEHQPDTADQLADTDPVEDLARELHYMDIWEAAVAGPARRLLGARKKSIEEQDEKSAKRRAKIDRKIRQNFRP